MPSAIDLPIREGAVPRFESDVEQPTFKWPSFLYWLKAGVGFTIGSVIVGFFVRVFQIWLSLEMLQAWARHLSHR